VDAEVVLFEPAVGHTERMLDQTRAAPAWLLVAQESLGDSCITEDLVEPY
jgi:hypothetical protein